MTQVPSDPAPLTSSLLAGVLPQGVFTPPTPSELWNGLKKKFGRKEEPTVRYVLQFREQADLSGVAKLPNGVERRQAAWNALVGTANLSRERHGGLLDQWKSSGVVKSLESYALGNTLEVKVPEKLHEQFAADAERAGVFQLVQRVDPEGPINPMPPKPRKPTRREAQADRQKTNGPRDRATFEWKAGTSWDFGQLQMGELWKKGATGKNVTVGVYDTGADMSHPALAHMWKRDKETGWLTGNAEAYGKHDRPIDPGSHGSHIAGKIGGKLDGRTFGMAPDVDMMVAGLERESIIGTFDWFLAPGKGEYDDPARDAAKGAQIVSNSWGLIGKSGDQYAKALDTPLRQLKDAGVITVFAAGNSGPGFGTMLWPGKHDAVITVSASDRDGTIADFSSRDDGTAPSKQKPDVVAPGVGTPSTVPVGQVDEQLAIARLANIATGGVFKSLAGFHPVEGTDGSMWTMSGTSMAAPATSGVIAAIQSQFPNLDQDDWTSMLRKHSIDMGMRGHDPIYGGGRLDPPRLYDAARERSAQKQAAWERSQQQQAPQAPQSQLRPGSGASPSVRR